MRYTINGRLCGHICPDQHEPIYPGAVRLYRLPDNDEVNDDSPVNEDQTRVVETFKIMSDDEIRSLESRYIGEIDLEQDGGFSFEGIDEKQDSYFGGPFIIHVRVEGVQGQPDSDTAPVQARLATAYPVWDRTQDGQIVNLDPFCVSEAFWCSIRKLFDAWVICGTVTDCETGQGLVGLTVRAFDTDIIQTDAIGNATTGPDGQFRIDYSSADFKDTTFPTIDIELIGGPDLHFTIETSGGTELYRENTSEGRTESRENVSPCFHVDLCIEDVVVSDEPLFRRIGKVGLTGIDDTSGLMTAGVYGIGGTDYAFYRDLSLEGTCPAVVDGKPYRYRFLYRLGGTETPITSDNIRPEPAGTVVLSGGEVRDIVVAPDTYDGNVEPDGTPRTPPQVVVSPDAQGWITVDPTAENRAFGTSGALMRFETRTVAQLEGGSPGSTRPAGEPADPQQDGELIEIIFQAEPVDGSEPQRFEERQNVYINNWAPIALLERDASNPCEEEDSMLTIAYTIDHEHLKSWNVNIVRADRAFDPPEDDPLTGNTPRGQSGTIDINVSDWETCSYDIFLTWDLRLTNGSANYSGRQRRVPFFIA